MALLMLALLISIKVYSIPISTLDIQWKSLSQPLFDINNRNQFGRNRFAFGIENDIVWTYGGSGILNNNEFEPDNTVRAINITSNTFIEYNTLLSISVIFPYDWGTQIGNIVYFSPYNCTGNNYPTYCGSTTNDVRPFYKYNIDTNALIEVSSIVHNGIGSAKCAIKINNEYYILAIGGIRDNVAQSIVYMYYVNGNMWQQIANLNQPRNNAGCIGYNDKAYVFGGTASLPHTNRKPEIYDPYVNQWVYSDATMSIDTSEAISLILVDEDLLDNPVIYGAGGVYLQTFFHTFMFIYDINADSLKQASSWSSHVNGAQFYYKPWKTLISILGNAGSWNTIPDTISIGCIYDNGESISNDPHNICPKAPTSNIIMDTDSPTIAPTKSSHTPTKRTTPPTTNTIQPSISPFSGTKTPSESTLLPSKSPVKELTMTTLSPSKTPSTSPINTTQITAPIDEFSDIDLQQNSVSGGLRGLIIGVILVLFTILGLSCFYLYLTKNKKSREDRGQSIKSKSEPSSPTPDNGNMYQVQGMAQLSFYLDGVKKSHNSSSMDKPDRHKRGTIDVDDEINGELDIDVDNILHGGAINLNNINTGINEMIEGDMETIVAHIPNNGTPTTDVDDDAQFKIDINADDVDVIKDGAGMETPANVDDDDVIYVVNEMERIQNSDENIKKLNQQTARDDQDKVFGIVLQDKQRDDELLVDDIITEMNQSNNSN